MFLYFLSEAQIEGKYIYPQKYKIIERDLALIFYPDLAQIEEKLKEQVKNKIEKSPETLSVSNGDLWLGVEVDTNLFLNLQYFPFFEIIEKFFKDYFTYERLKKFLNPLTEVVLYKRKNFVSLAVKRSEKGMEEILKIPEEDCNQLTLRMLELLKELRDLYAKQIPFWEV